MNGDKKEGIYYKPQHFPTIHHYQNQKSSVPHILRNIQWLCIKYVSPIFLFGKLSYLVEAVPEFSIECFFELPRACNPWVQKRGGGVYKLRILPSKTVVNRESSWGKKRKKSKKKERKKKAYKNRVRGGVTQLLTCKKQQLYFRDKHFYPITKNLFRRK